MVNGYVEKFRGTDTQTRDLCSQSTGLAHHTTSTRHETLRANSRPSLTALKTDTHSPVHPPTHHCVQRISAEYSSEPMSLSVSLPGATRLELTGTSPNSYFAYSTAAQKRNALVVTCWSDRAGVAGRLQRAKRGAFFAREGRSLYVALWYSCCR